MIHPATPLPAGVTQIASCFRDNEVGHRRAPAHATSSKPTGEPAHDNGQHRPRPWVPEHG
jgi:hypothetical protein